MCRSAIEQMQAFKVQVNSSAGYARQAASDLILVPVDVCGLMGFGFFFISVDRNM